MKKLRRKLYFVVCCLLFVLFLSASLRSINAQEEIEIPGPDLKDASFIPVNDLKVGDWVFVKSGEENLVPEKITKLERIEGSVEVYNLTVEGDETFFANSFAVHNKNGGGSERVVGRVWKDGTVQTGYSITSADGKTASWAGSGSDAYYYIGRWGTGNQVTITVNNPDPGYTCSTWGFDNQPNVPGGEASGTGCSATVTIGSGSYSPDWQNHLHFNLAVCSILSPPTGLMVSYSDCAPVAEANVTVNLDWNDVPGATQYALRVNDYANDWSGTCAWTYDGDICIDNLTSSSYSFTGKGGHTYSWWVHAINNCGWSGASGGPEIKAPICKGTITGNVYQNLGGACSGSDSPSDSGWLVTCVGEAARKDSASQFTCLSGGSDQLPYSTYVINLSPPTGWEVIIGAGCQQNPTSVILDSLSEEVTPPFYIWQGADPWFQTQEGDVHAQGSISSDIPSAGIYFNLVGDGGTPGVVSHKDPLGPDPWGSGSVSETGWLANTEFPRKHFDYFYQLLGSPETENWDGRVANFPSDPGTGETEIIYTTSPARLPGFSNLSGRKIVVLASSNAIIENDITISDGFLAVIASGQINIDDLVSEVHGVYIADGHISTGDGSLAFTGKGMFIANSFSLGGRDLGAGNNTEAAVKFIYRPDLWLNAPAELLIPSYTWQELAP